MKIKILIIGLAVLGHAFCCHAQSVQYVTVLADYQNGSFGRLSVQTNQIITLEGFDRAGQPPISALITNGNGGTDWLRLELGGACNQPPQKITGVYGLSVQGQSAGYTWATFKIETPWPPVMVISNYVPADCVVIPASATGNVQVILESSPDLVNWTAAMPGTYGPSAATNRFFRVRAVAN